MSRHTRRFVRLAATIAPDKTLPYLPIVGWHLNQPERARQEIDAPQGAGYSVPMEQYDADRLPAVPSFRHGLTDTWTRFDIPIPELVVRQMRLIDSAQTVYASLAETFASSDPDGDWDVSKLAPGGQTLAADHAVRRAGGHRVQVAFKHDRGVALQVGTPNFPPQVRRVVAVRHPGGRIGRGAVLVRVQPLLQRLRPGPVDGQPGGGRVR